MTSENRSDEVDDTLNRGQPGAMFRCHGVSKGVRDRFFEFTQEGSGFTVHRPMAMHRPTWSAEEREEKITKAGGSRQNIDYKRNVYGEPPAAAIYKSPTKGEQRHWSASSTYDPSTRELLDQPPALAMAKTSAPPARMALTAPRRRL